jgi:hypothetical protein
MNKDLKLNEKIADVLLRFADEQRDLSRSDFQGRADIVAGDIINLIRGSI